MTIEQPVAYRAEELRTHAIDMLRAHAVARHRLRLTEERIVALALSYGISDDEVDKILWGPT